MDTIGFSRQWTRYSHPLRTSSLRQNSKTVIRLSRIGTSRTNAFMFFFEPWTRRNRQRWPRLLNNTRRFYGLAAAGFASCVIDAIGTSLTKGKTSTKCRVSVWICPKGGPPLQKSAPTLTSAYNAVRPVCTKNQLVHEIWMIKMNPHEGIPTKNQHTPSAGIPPKLRYRFSLWGVPTQNHGSPSEGKLWTPH